MQPLGHEKSEFKFDYFVSRKLYNQYMHRPSSITGMIRLRALANNSGIARKIWSIPSRRFGPFYSNHPYLI